jgi:hypothetical protein
MTSETAPNYERDSNSSNEPLKLSARALLRAMFNKNNEKNLEVFGDTDDSFVDSLKIIMESLGEKMGVSVIYPGSGAHVGVARVFGKEYVVHVDPDTDAFDALNNNGYAAVKSTIEDYMPAEPADGMVALNSYGTPSKELIGRLVKSGGFVVANNYTHWASELAKMGETLELVGAVMPDYHPHDSEFVDVSKIPEGATEIDKEYILVDRDANVKPGTPEIQTLYLFSSAPS